MKAVTFDVTGTLLSCPRLGEIYAEVLGRHGHEVSAAQVAELFGVVWRELDCGVAAGRDRFSGHPEGARGFWLVVLSRLGEYLDFVPTRFAAAELYDRFARGEAWSVYPEVPEVLDRLSARGLRLGVISNWDQRLPHLLADLGLAPRFDCIVYSADLGIAKPHPDIFLAATRALGIEASEVLHVGDSPLEDRDGAVAAGLEAWLLERRRGATLCDLLERLTSTNAARRQHPQGRPLGK